MTVIKRLDQIDNPDGNIQRFLTVSGFGWNDIAFTQAPFRSDFIKSLAQLYRVAIIPKNPSEAGHLIFFHVPDTVDTASMPRTIGGVKPWRYIAPRSTTERQQCIREPEPEPVCWTPGLR